MENESALASLTAHVTELRRRILWAFAAMIEQQPSHHEQLGAFYQQKRDAFAAHLATTRFRTLPVQGGYFQLVDYSAISDLPDADFCRWLTIEKGVAAIPLSPFYETPPQGQKLARLCFAKLESTLDAAIAPCPPPEPPMGTALSCPVRPVDFSTWVALRVRR